MKFLSKKGVFPWFTVIEGIVGFFMQCWLFSSADSRGLLPRFHFAAIASFVLLAITLVICWVGARAEHDLSPDKMFLAYPPASAGIFLSAIGFAISGFTVTGFSFLRFLTPICGILAGAALGYIAYCRLKGLHADCLVHCVITVYLILRTMTCCSNWSSEPQFLRYFFPLLACCFLLITSYHRAMLALGEEHCRQYVFFSQLALFCCCMCCRGSDWLFYLSAALWLTFDCPAPSSLTTGRFMK